MYFLSFLILVTTAMVAAAPSIQSAEVNIKVNLTPNDNAMGRSEKPIGANLDGNKNQGGFDSHQQIIQSQVSFDLPYNFTLRAHQSGPSPDYPNPSCRVREEPKAPEVLPIGWDRANSFAVLGLQDELALRDGKLIHGNRAVSIALNLYLSLASMDSAYTFVAVHHPGDHQKDRLWIEFEGHEYWFASLLCFPFKGNPVAAFPSLDHQGSYSRLSSIRPSKTPEKLSVMRNGAKTDSC